MIVNETLPVISDPILGGGVPSVIVSTVLIVMYVFHFVSLPSLVLPCVFEVVSSTSSHTLRLRVSSLLCFISTCCTRFLFLSSLHSLVSGSPQFTRHGLPHDATLAQPTRFR